MPKGNFAPLVWRNPNSSGIRIENQIMKKSLQLINTAKGVHTKKGLRPNLNLRKKRNGNLELVPFDPKLKVQGLLAINTGVLKDGKFSFWYTIRSEVRQSLEYEARKGKLRGFFIIVNREKNIELIPVIKRYDEQIK